MSTGAGVEHPVGGGDHEWTGLGGVLSQSPPLLIEKPSVFQSPPGNGPCLSVSRN